MNKFVDVIGYIGFNVFHPVRQIAGLYCTVVNDLNASLGKQPYPDYAEFLTYRNYVAGRKS